MSALIDRIRRALADPLNRDDVIDPMQELGALLSEVGLDPASGGGAVSFAGRDPIVASPLPFATMAAVALMAKSISVAALWRFRGGAGQDMSVDLGQALHRLCPFYDRKWELLNGYAPGNPADPSDPFMPTNMYPTRDGRRALFMNIYPRIRSAALAFLGCNDDPRAIGAVIRKWDAFEFEEQANRAGLQATIIRSADEFLQSEQCHYLASLPLVHIEKIADGEPQPFFANPARPLDGVRALGFSHVIAGPGMGRAFAYHGADVLNIWQPTSFEMDFNYYTANVGMRSATLDLSHPEGIGRLRRLVSQADVFFANRRPGQIESWACQRPSWRRCGQASCRSTFRFMAGRARGRVASGLITRRAAYPVFWHWKVPSKHRCCPRSSLSTITLHPGSPRSVQSPPSDVAQPRAEVTASTCLWPAYHYGCCGWGYSPITHAR